MSSATATDKVELRMEFDRGGAFDFGNCTRNVALCKMGMAPPRLWSTGTTIVAAIYDGGVVMGADTRATAGNIIADKNIVKVHKLTDSIYACGAGTAADLDQVTNMLAGNMRLMELNTGRKARVITALRHAKQHLFQYQGYIGAYLLIGGVDPTGSHLYMCSANGTTMAFPYTAQGSGSYAAITVLERDYKPNMTKEEAADLCSRALIAGMHGDNMSGNSFRLVIIEPKQTENRGPIVPDFCKLTEPKDLEYKFKPGSTKVLKQKTIKYEVLESMDVSH